MSLSAHAIGQTGMLLASLAILVVAAIQFLVALWGATSSRSRLTRAMVVWGAIVLLMPIGAYVPALVFTLNAALTAGLVAAIRRFQGKSPSQIVPQRGYRFHLADVFVVILFVATLLALAKYSQFYSVIGYLLVTLLVAPLAMTIAFAHHAVTGPWRFRMAIATFVSTVISTALLQLTDLAQVSPIPLSLHASSEERQEILLHTMLLACLIACFTLPACMGTRLSAKTSRPWQRPAYLLALAVATGIGLLLAWYYWNLLWIATDRNFPRQLVWIALNATPLVGLALLVALATWLSRLHSENRNVRWLQTIRAISLVSAAAVAIPLAWLYWQMLWRTPFPPPPAGATNHYERIIAISRELEKTNWRYLGNTVPTSLQPLVDEAVSLLAEPNYVPTPVLEAESLNPFKGLRGHDLLAFYSYLTAALRAAEEKNEFDRGADYAVAGLRFAMMLERGGTSELVSSWGTGYLKWLADHREQISTAKAREVVQILDRSLAEREDFAVLYARSLVSAERSGGCQARLASILADPARLNSHAAWPKESYKNSELSIRSVQVLFAIRLFQSDHGRLPTDLAELTPKYLLALPLDPFSQRPLIYRPTGEIFALYSVGRDLTDDGGNFNQANYYQHTGYDLDLRWPPSP